MFGQSQVDGWVKNDATMFSIDRDCGLACSSWTLLRKDLPFTFFASSKSELLSTTAFGYIADLNKLKPKIVAMSPIDSDSSNRSCCAQVPLVVSSWPTPNAAYCSSMSCAANDVDCKAFRTGSGMHPDTLQAQGVGGCSSASEIASGSCSLCAAGKPHWCDNVTSAQDWMARYWKDTSTNLMGVGSSQCKFRKSQWDTWTETIKQVHANCSLDAGCAAARSEVGYVENELNLYFDPNEKGNASQTLWEEAIEAIVYVELEDTENTGNERFAADAARLVSVYNERHTKQILLYRLVKKQSDLTDWQSGVDVNLLDHLQPVPT